MEQYTIPGDIKLIGRQVVSFPAGIKDAFNDLMGAFGNPRTYYGISWMDDTDKVIYYAAATQLQTDNELEEGYESLCIEKGDYNMENVYEWMSKTEHIKDIFYSLMQERTPVKSRPCVEWYVSDHELRCLIRTL